MKILNLRSLIAFSVLMSSSLASFAHCSPYYCYPNRCSGFYLGVLGGTRYVNSNADAFGRIMAGYDFNQQLALEVGVLASERGRFHHNNDFYTDDVSLLAKFSVPLACRLSGYAKGGVSIIQSQFYFDDNHNLFKDSSHYYTRPQVGAGLSYAFTPRLSGQLEYLRTFVCHNYNDSNFFGAGLTVKLGGC